MITRRLCGHKPRLLPFKSVTQQYKINICYLLLSLLRSPIHKFTYYEGLYITNLNKSLFWRWKKPFSTLRIPDWRPGRECFLWSKSESFSTGNSYKIEAHIFANGKSICFVGHWSDAVSDHTPSHVSKRKLNLYPARSVETIMKRAKSAFHFLRKVIESVLARESLQIKRLIKKTKNKKQGKDNTF